MFNQRNFSHWFLTGTECYVKTTEGDCCVFPFIYRSKKYQSCTTVDNGNIPWCATTSNYDTDEMRGQCKIENRGEIILFTFFNQRKKNAGQYNA